MSNCRCLRCRFPVYRRLDNCRLRLYRRWWCRWIACPLRGHQVPGMLSWKHFCLRCSGPCPRCKGLWPGRDTCMGTMG